MRYKTFKPRFHALILAGVKTTTIRENAMLRVGETFALRYWTGAAYRSKMGTLGTARVASIRRIEWEIVGWSICMRIERRDLDAAEVEAVARADGFKDSNDFGQFMLEAKRRDFDGSLIAWDGFTADASQEAVG